MRIELPPASWTDAAPRAEDDAHTLTLVAQSADAWRAPAALIDPSQTLRTGIGPAAVETLTLTF